jgi:hypothetical protein
MSSTQVFSDGLLLILDICIYVCTLLVGRFFIENLLFNNSLSKKSLFVNTLFDSTLSYISFARQHFVIYTFCSIILCSTALCPTALCPTRPVCQSVNFFGSLWAAAVNLIQFYINWTLIIGFQEYRSIYSEKWPLSSLT